MSGDFRHDITRDTFRPHRHFSRVLMQQGRVQIDADWNEQIDILLHYMRTFIADVVGPYAAEGNSFRVSQQLALPEVGERSRRGRQRTAQPAQTPQPVPYHFKIEKGHYYVDGILCENDEEYIYGIPRTERPDPNQGETEFYYLLYLDVWELEVTYLEDSYIREIALGGSDTATRAQVIWRIRSALLPSKKTPPPARKEKPAGDTSEVQYSGEETRQYLRGIIARDRGLLKAKVVEPREDDKTPCTVSPKSRYRGLENQLYRVEIHEGGSVSDGQPTFKWSRENGSVLFAIESEVVGGQNLTKLTLTLRSLGRDDVHYGLQIDDWVEIVNRRDALDDVPGALFRVDSIDYPTRQVTLVANSSSGVTINTGSGPMRNPFLRRWDYRDIDPSRRSEPQLAESGALKLVENKPLELENGIEITFYRDLDSKEAPVYRTRDYWLIPARVATGRIEWPQDGDDPDALPPHGVEHHYAPLALATLRGGVAQGTDNPHDLRQTIKSV